MISIFFLFLGVLLLVYGANFLVDGASVIAKRFNIPNIVIGLTIVAFGTSAPELVVNVIASIGGNSAITLGNVIGSNIINILVILGITSIISPLVVTKNTVRFEIPIAILSSLVVFELSRNEIISNIDGWILITLFLCFIAYNSYLIVVNKEESELEVKNYSLKVSILITLLGFVFLIFGGRYIVSSAVTLARSFGISERIISITLVSFGTSLPELATSVVAALKKNTDIAIGNVVGSNIFNTLFILGVSSTISPIAVPANASIDLYLNIVASILLLVAIFKGYILNRVHGILFLAIYSSYLYYILR